MNTLKNISFDYLIDNEEVEKLLFLYNSNKLTNAQKNKVASMFFTNMSFIVPAVEKYSDELNRFKYKNEVLTLYDFIFSRDIYRKAYINRMTNFNENDSAFLWFILYQLLFVNVPRVLSENLNHNFMLPENKYNDINHRFIVYKPYVKNKFEDTDHVQKMVGVIRVKEFGFDINEYISLWKELDTFFFDDGEYLFRAKDNFLDIKLTYDYKLSLLDKKYKHLNKHTKFELFKYNNKYYVKEYMLRIYVINENKLNIDKVVEKNPFIKDASKYLIDIVPFVEGKVDIIKSYDGAIVGGKYVMSNIYDDTFDISSYNIYEIYDEYAL